MNVYLYETSCDDFCTSGLSDEEIIYVTANEKLHTNRKKKFQKEILEHGKESDYDFYR